MADFLDLWQEHCGRLQAFIRRRVPDHSAVDDIVQEVFIKAHENLHKLRSTGKLGPWLYRIAQNAILDYYRAQRPEVELPPEVECAEPERDVYAELAQCLAPLIAELPPDYQTALTLSDIDGLTQKEVAARLGLSLSGAKSRVQRGREKLLERYRRCCDYESGSNGVVDFHPRDKGRCG